jgi:hypothetical protein
MLRLTGVVLAIMLFSPSFDSAREDFAKYRAVEAYEIRPGILMMPRYSADGHVCEIGLEDLHYTPALVKLDSQLSPTMIDQIFSELVPEDERGPRTAFDGLISGAGFGQTETKDFEHVSLQIYRKILSDKKKKITVGNPTAVIRWKAHECQKP